MPDFSIRRLFWLSLRIGNLTFGGGNPTMAVFHQELVAFRQWLTSEQYALVYGLARVTPGTNLLAFCAGVGWTVGGWLGAVAAVVAVGGPCGVLAIWLTVSYDSVRQHPPATAAIGGMLAAVAGLMAGAAWHLLGPAIQSPRRLKALLLAGAALTLVALGIGPVWILGLGAATGSMWLRK